MMTNKDLMIGDYVDAEFTVNGTEMKPGYCKITELTESWCRVDTDEGYAFTLDYMMVKPKPLTKEIVKKNMSRYIQNLEVCSINGLMVNFDDKYDDIDIGTIGNGIWGDEFQYFSTIGSVHELQHAMKLFGIEKELKV